MASEPPRFASSTQAFSLKINPAGTLSSPPSVNASLNEFSTRAGPQTGPNASTRRQSLLSSHVYARPEIDVDAEMLQEEDALLIESEEDYNSNNATRLGSPFLGNDSQASSSSGSPFSVRPTPIAKPWPRSASASAFTLPRNPPASPQPQEDFLQIPINGKSFNPLNPTPADKQKAPHSGMDIEMPSPAHAWRMSVARPLQRAKSSPSLRKMDDEPITPPPQTAYRTHEDAFDATTASFQGLGVLLPNFNTQKETPPGDSLPSPVQKGPQRRAVQRRGSLYPKIKAHLRVQAQLAEESNAADIDEMLSEAALHRLHTSRPTVTSPHMRSTSIFGNMNRFPETATDEDDYFAKQQGSYTGQDSPSSSDGCGAVGDAAEINSQFDGDEMSSVNGVSGIDVEQWRRDREMWLGFREKQSPSGGNTGAGLSRSLGTTSNGGMEVDAPPSSTAVTRPGKRKWADSDRFEPYSSMSFKRRAVSPTASLSSALGSPVLGNGSTASSMTGNNSNVQPINIAQPNSSTFFASIGHSPSSRGGSPAPRERVLPSGISLGFIAHPPNQSETLAETDDDLCQGMMEEIEM